MLWRTYRNLSLMLFIAALCGSLLAQNDKTITVRMLDSRTGKLIATSDFLVRVNHDQTLHGNWIVQNDDGTGKLTVPADAAVLSVQATYDSATMVYVNCDTNKDLGSSDHAAALDHWYPISAILASGVVAPNGCAGKKIPEKLQVVAKPGEFVFFVRKRNTREEFKD